MPASAFVLIERTSRSAVSPRASRTSALRRESRGRGSRRARVRHGVACEPCDEDETQVFQRVGVPGREVGTGGDEAIECGERVALAAFALRLRDELHQRRP